LLRYSTEGSTDAGFGTKGIASYNAGPGTFSTLAGIAIEKDGTIVGAGYDGADGLLLVGWNTNGTLDTAFGAQGVVRFESGNLRGQLSWYETTQILVQPDAKLIVAGDGQAIYSAPEELAAARFNPDGSLDQTFGNGGQELVQLGGSGARSMGMAVAPDGSLVVVGVQMEQLTRDPRPNALDGPLPGVLAVVHYSADGTDPSVQIPNIPRERDQHRHHRHERNHRHEPPIPLPPIVPFPPVWGPILPFPRVRISWPVTPQPPGEGRDHHRDHRHERHHRHELPIEPCPPVRVFPLPPVRIAGPVTPQPPGETPLPPRIRAVSEQPEVVTTRPNTGSAGLQASPLAVDVVFAALASAPGIGNGVNPGAQPPADPISAASGTGFVVVPMPTSTQSQSEAQARISGGGDDAAPGDNLAG
jgi:uncharacterized delta-60 repeat protein